MKILLVGNPNVGKSTLFNKLVLDRQKISNVPGTTVEVESGFWKIQSKNNSKNETSNQESQSWEVIDTPGMYSLLPFSPDEKVASDYVLESLKSKDNHILYIINSVNYSSSLYLLKQLINLKVNLTIIGSKSDLKDKIDSTFDLEKLEAELGQKIPLVNLKKTYDYNFLADLIEDNQKKNKNSKKNSEIKINPEKFNQEIKAKAPQDLEWVGTFDIKKEAKVNQNLTEKLDKVLLSPIWAIPFFLLVLFLVFQATTWLATPLIDLIDVNLQDLVTGGVESLFDYFGWSESWVLGLINDGLLAGIFTVLTFIPPMAIMFILMNILEESGYLARVALVVNKVMNLMNLDGRAFIPLLIGFGCNLPSYEGTKVLNDSRQRQLTSYMIPFSLCAARMVVFLVLAYAFFGQYAGVGMFIIYLISILMIFLVGISAQKLFPSLKNMKNNMFIIDLPQYQFPDLKNLLFSTLYKLKNFCFEASKIIVSVLIIMWFFIAIPMDGVSKFGEVENIHDSLYGKVSDVISPIFKPLGFDDWHFSSALVTGFVAKEVFVGALIQSYDLDIEEDSEELENSDNPLAIDIHSTLTKTSQDSIFNSNSTHLLPALWSLFFFILCYTPCLATFAEAKRQFGSKFAFKSLALSLIVAYLGSFLIFQIGSLF